MLGPRNGARAAFALLNIAGAIGFLVGPMLGSFTVVVARELLPGSGEAAISLSPYLTTSGFSLLVALAVWFFVPDAMERGVNQEGVASGPEGRAALPRLLVISFVTAAACGCLRSRPVASRNASSRHEYLPDRAHVQCVQPRHVGRSNDRLLAARQAGDHTLVPRARPCCLGSERRRRAIRRSDRAYGHRRSRDRGQRWYPLPHRDVLDFAQCGGKARSGIGSADCGRKSRPSGRIGRWRSAVWGFLRAKRALHANGPRGAGRRRRKSWYPGPPGTG